MTLANDVGSAPACSALGIPRASFYWKLTPMHGHTPGRPRPSRGLSDSEQKTVLAYLYSPRFQNHAPMEIFATLLDEGQ